MEHNRPVGAAPYVPFKTFLTAIESFQRGLPDRVDRSVWPSHSGAAQGQLLAASRFLGLIDEEGCPSADLRELVQNPEHRRRTLRRILERSYTELGALDLAKASPRQIEEALRRYGISGHTHRKAVSFFLQAASYAERPLSVLLQRKTREPGLRRAGARTPVAASTPARRESKMVRLRSGGTLTLVMDVKLAEMARADREFLFGLLDQMAAYEQGASEPRPSGNDVGATQDRFDSP
jgi:hypothetical protein